MKDNLQVYFFLIKQQWEASLLSLIMQPNKWQETKLQILSLTRKTQFLCRPKLVAEIPCWAKVWRFFWYEDETCQSRHVTKFEAIFSRNNYCKYKFLMSCLYLTQLPDSDIKEGTFLELIF